MPLLFSLAIHNALAEVREGMLPTELFFASLDDILVVSNPGRTRALFDLLGEKLAHVGIRLPARKTRMWNKSSARPPNMDAKYHELLSGEKCRLVVVALETGGRWSSEAIEFVMSLGWVPNSGRSSAVAWIRFPLLAKKVDQDVVSVLREGLCDLVGLFQGRLLTGKTGLRPIWSSCFQLDLCQCRVSFSSVLCQQRCF